MDIAASLDAFTRRDWQEIDPDAADPFRLAIVGLGWWASDEAIPAIEASELCETTVLVSSDKEKAQDLTDLTDAIERGITYDEFHEGAASDAYDAVYVCTPNALHLPHVEAAADLGKAAICEKPLEASVDRARRMVEHVRDAGTTLMTAYRMQVEPAARRARELVADGAIGEVVSAHGQMSGDLLGTIPDPDQWRLDPDLVGFGATVADIGVYPLNTLRFVLQRDPAAVQAQMASPDEAFQSVPDEHATFTLEFPEHVYAACTVSQNATHAGHLRIVGTEGELQIDPAFDLHEPCELTLTRGDRSATIATERVDQMAAEFDYLADRVRRDAPVEPDGEDGLFDVATLAAIFEAAEREARVEITPPVVGEDPND